MTPPVPRYICEKDAAALLGLQRATLSNMRSQRRGPPYHRLGGGRVIRYRPDELQEWAERFRVDPEADR